MTLSNKWIVRGRIRGSGQSMVLLTAALPVLVGMAALATDVTCYYMNWFSLQRGVDAAVLSGANYLPNYPSQAISTAQGYATHNGLAQSEITSTTAGANNTTLTMTAQRKVSFYLAEIMGLSSGTVSASGTAQLTSVGAAMGTAPLGVDYRTSYTFGQTVLLHQDQVGPGNWGALALGGTGSSTYINNLENGYGGTVKVGDLLLTQPGKDPCDTQQGVNYRINEGLQVDPSGTFSSHTLTDPRVILAPMVDFSNVNGQSQVPVMGFAQLWIVGVDNQGTITTYFIQQTAPGTQPNSAVQGFGAYSSILVD